jgi:hypothetical protein
MLLPPPLLRAGGAFVAGDALMYLGASIRLV